MKNYKAENFGQIQQLHKYVFAPEGTPIRLEGKCFLAQPMGLSSMEVSLNQTPAGKGMTFFHRHHKHEELYIFLGGEGEMSIDDEIIPVKEGSVVSVQPAAKRSWWNTGKSALTYIVIQAPVGGMKAPSGGDGEIIEGKVPWM